MRTQIDYSAPVNASVRFTHSSASWSGTWANGVSSTAELYTVSFDDASSKDTVYNSADELTPKAQVPDHHAELMS